MLTATCSDSHRKQPKS